MTIQFSQYNPEQTYTGQKKFDCGNDIINRYVRDGLKKQVRQNLCAAYVLLDDQAEHRLVGLYTLAQHNINLGMLGQLDLGSMPRIIPCTRLVMLGVDVAYQGQNQGKRLMIEALVMTKTMANHIGSYGMYLDGEASAVAFYQKMGFVLLEGNLAPQPSPMFLPLARFP
jgi:ribosomal protein S18 acetylase RimI-like enzyme